MAFDPNSHEVVIARRLAHVIMPGAIMASNGMTPEQRVNFWSGLLVSIAGGACGDIGHEQAFECLLAAGQSVADVLERQEDQPLPPADTPVEHRE